METNILIFVITGEEAGQWVMRHDYARPVLKLLFSADGGLLLSHTKVRNLEKMFIYSNEIFSNEPPRLPGPNNGLEGSVGEIDWEDEIHKPKDVAFSSDGNMVAICTTHSADAKAKIRLLRKGEDHKWKTWGVQMVTIFPTNDARECTGAGLTGISL
jgi:hypothetical protein